MSTASSLKKVKILYIKFFRIILRRGPRGFGFTVHTIRVYFGDTDYYTMHHTVMAIDEGSPGKDRYISFETISFKV